MSTRRDRPLRFESVGVSGAGQADDELTTAGATTTAPPTPQGDAWVEALNKLARWTVLLVMVALLELLPVQAWLMTLAAYQTGDARLTAEPFWLLALTLAALGAGGRLTAASGPRLRIGAGIAIGVVALTVGLLVPTSAFATSAPIDKPVAFVGQMALVAYLGWRGLGAGATVPFSLAFERFRRIFTYGTAALVGAITISVAAPTSARSPLIGALGLFLPIEIFAGLLTLAISKAAFQRASARGAEPALSDEARWLGMASGLAALVVALALIFSLFVSFPSISLALTRLGPLGVMVNNALTWLVNSFAYLLYLIFNVPISLIKDRNIPFTKPNVHPDCVDRGTGTPPPLKPGQIYCAPTRVPTVPATILTAVWVTVVVVVGISILFMLFILIRDLTRRGLRLLRRHAELDTDEEREDLDARSLLGAQLRDLLGARRPHPRPEEPLPQGSVRWLYREALRAAGARGVVRAPGETPDEFAARLAPVLGALAPAGRNTRAPSGDGSESQADLAELSEAYNRARYDDYEPAGRERATLRDHATRLIRRLRGDGKRR